MSLISSQELLFNSSNIAAIEKTCAGDDELPRLRGSFLGKLERLENYSGVEWCGLKSIPGSNRLEVSTNTIVKFKLTDKQGNEYTKSVPFENSVIMRRGYGGFVLNGDLMIVLRDGQEARYARLNETQKYYASHFLGIANKAAKGEIVLDDSHILNLNKFFKDVVGFEGLNKVRVLSEHFPSEPLQSPVITLKDELANQRFLANNE